MSDELKVNVHYPLQNPEDGDRMVDETLKIRDKGKKLKDLITKTINDALNVNFNNNSYDVFVLDEAKNWKEAIGKDTDLEYLAIKYGNPLNVVVVTKTFQGGRRKRRKARKQSRKKTKTKRRRKSRRRKTKRC
jgi:hypothetical protein